jgi:uncharacterized protein YqeY
MTLHERIEHDYLVAFKAHEQSKVNLLRMMKAAMKNAEIELRVETLNDEQAIAVLSREAKRRRESADAFTKGGRQDLATQELAECDLIHTYLPAQLGDDELNTIVTATIAELQATPKEFGKVMSAVMAKVKGQADGNRVSAAVRNVLK